MTSAVDVRDAESVKSWIKDTVDKVGTLDGAANVAGCLQDSVANSIIY